MTEQVKKSDDIRALIEERHEDIRQLRMALREVLIEEHEYRIGDVLLTKKGEMKIVRMKLEYDYLKPVAVKRKKDGTWGALETTLYSWNLEGAKVVDHQSDGEASAAVSEADGPHA
jgi:hypothetical protein